MGKDYELKVKRNSFCLKIFALICAVNDQPNENPMVEATQYFAKKEAVMSFLSAFWEDENLSEYDPVSPNVRRISSMHAKQQLWFLLHSSK